MDFIFLQKEKIIMQAHCLTIVLYTLTHLYMDIMYLSSYIIMIDINRIKFTAKICTYGPSS